MHPQTPTQTAPTYGHGAVALLDAAALIAARRLLDTPGTSPGARRAAAATLTQRGSAADRARGAAILAAASPGGAR